MEEFGFKDLIALAPRLLLPNIYIYKYMCVCVCVQVQVQVVYSRLRANSDKTKLGNAKQVFFFLMSTLSVCLCVA